MLNDFEFFVIEITQAFNTYEFEKAIFISERLFAELPNCQTIFLLATSYYRAQLVKLAYSLLQNQIYKDFLATSYNRILYAKIAYQLGYHDKIESILIDNLVSNNITKLILTDKIIETLIDHYTSPAEILVHTDKMIYYTNPTQALNILAKQYIKTQDFDNAKLCIYNSIKCDSFLNWEAINLLHILHSSKYATNPTNKDLVALLNIGIVPNNLDKYHIDHMLTDNSILLPEFNTPFKDLTFKDDSVSEKLVSKMDSSNLIRPLYLHNSNTNTNIPQAPQKPKQNIQVKHDIKPRVCTNIKNIFEPNIGSNPLCNTLVTLPLHIASDQSKLKSLSNIQLGCGQTIINSAKVELSQNCGIKRRSIRISHQSVKANRGKYSTYNGSSLKENHNVRINSIKKPKLMPQKGKIIDFHKRHLTECKQSNLKNITNHQIKKIAPKATKNNSYNLISEECKENYQAMNFETNVKPSNIPYTRKYGYNGTKPSIKCVDDCTQIDIYLFHDTSLLRKLAPVIQTLARATLSLARYEARKAADQFLELPKAHLDTPAVLTALGQAYYELVDYKQACDTYRRSLELWPDYVAGIHYFSTCLWHLKLEHELSILALDLANNHRTSAVTWCVAANCFALRNEHDQSIKALQRAIQVCPDMAYAYTILGHEYVCIGNMESGTSSFQNAIRLDKEHYNAWYGLGMIAFKMEKFKMAEYYYKKCLAINPNRAILVFHLGAVQKELGRNREALRSFDTAIARDPSNQLARFHKAALLFSLQRYPETLVELEKLKGIRPKEAKIYHMMGKVYWKLGKATDALKHLKWALQFDHNNAHNNKKLREDMDEVMAAASLLPNPPDPGGKPVDHSAPAYVSNYTTASSPPNPIRSHTNVPLLTRLLSFDTPSADSRSMVDSLPVLKLEDLGSQFSSFASEPDATGLPLTSFDYDIPGTSGLSLLRYDTPSIVPEDQRITQHQSSLGVANSNNYDRNDMCNKTTHRYSPSRMTSTSRSPMDVDTPAVVGGSENNFKVMVDNANDVIPDMTVGEANPLVELEAQLRLHLSNIFCEDPIEI